MPPTPNPKLIPPPIDDDCVTLEFAFALKTKTSFLPFPSFSSKLSSLTPLTPRSTLFIEPDPPPTPPAPSRISSLSPELKRLSRSMRRVVGLGLLVGCDIVSCTSSID